MKKVILFFAIFTTPLVKGQNKNIWSFKNCIDTALKKNVALNQAQYTNQNGKITYIQSKAALLPNLNLSDAQNFNSGYSLDPYTYQYTTQNISINNLSLNSSATLFNGFLLINTVKQNKLTYAAGVENVEKLKNDLRLNILAAYMQILMDYEAIDVAQTQIEATITQTEQTKKFVEFGKVAELNLFQIQSQLASDKLAKVNAENQLQLDKLVLMQLMETPVKDDFDIVRVELQELLPEIPTSTEEIDKIAESFLPQIKSVSLNILAAEYSVKMAKSAWMPKLTLTGILKTGYSSLRSTITQKISYNTETIGYVNGLPSQPVIGVVPITSINKQNEILADQLKNNFSQSVGFGLTVPIFNNLQAKSNVTIARNNLINAKLNEKQVKNDLRKSIETAYTNQIAASKKLIAIEEQLLLEKQTYHDMEKKYLAGATDATSFLIEKNNLNKASMSFIQAKYDYVLKAKIVDFYLGKPITP